MRCLKFAGLTFVLAVAGCSTDGASVVTPPPPPATGPFTLTVVPGADDRASAQALGWASGIPGATVVLALNDTGPGHTFTSSATGTITLAGLTPGDYRADVRRWLSPTELKQLPQDDDALGYLGTGTVRVTAGSKQDLAIPADHRRSVVISEWSFNPEVDSFGLAEYDLGGFLELYNNADTTIYLDGLVLGQAIAPQINYPTFPCDNYAPTLDPSGLWARNFERLPGRGTDYPLAPGQAVVLATDAIDHSRVVADGLDLRHADFEFKGFSDSDNPTVPNSIDIGVGPSPGGNGLQFFGIGVVAFVALPIEPTSLARRKVPGTALEWAIVPAGKLLDVLAIKSAYDTGFPECPVMVDPVFDRTPIQLFSDKPEDGARSYQRRVVAVATTGRKILQHTKTAATDFLVAERSPRRIP